MKPGAGFGVVMIHDDKVLLGRRHDDPKKADSELSGEGTWTMPGGKLEFGESFEEGARREVAEETGITLKTVSVIAVNNEMTEKAHFVTVGMYSDDFKGEPTVMEPDEITEWRWFALDDVPKNLFFPSRKLLQNYLKGKFYISDNA